MWEDRLVRRQQPWNRCRVDCGQAKRLSSRLHGGEGLLIDPPANKLTIPNFLKLDCYPHRNRIQWKLFLEFDGNCFWTVQTVKFD